MFIKPNLSIQPKHSLTIQNRKEAPYLDFIRNGTKKAEGRVNLHFFSKYSVGDTLQLHNRFEGILCEISFLHRYKNFEEMVTREGVENLVPHVVDSQLSNEELIRKAVAVYKSFPGADRVSRFGALAIGVTYLHEYFKGKGFELRERA